MFFLYVVTWGAELYKLPKFEFFIKNPEIEEIYYLWILFEIIFCWLEQNAYENDNKGGFSWTF